MKRYGGNVYERKGKHKSRTLYDWVASGEVAVAFYKRVRKHLVEKGVQVDLALSAVDYNYRTEMYKALHTELRNRKRVDHGKE